MLTSIKKKYIADKDFYIYILKLAIPMILQSVVTNFVSLLDNIMVGQIGTEQMSGVAIANQLIFVFNISIFGAVSGPGIFGAQFYGKGDHEGQKYTVRFRLFLTMVITVLTMLLFGFYGNELISMYLTDSGSAGNVASTLQYGLDYLGVMIIALIPSALGQAYASVERECGNTVIPMLGSFMAVFINLALDYTLIFGKFGMPCLGVKGAAIATVVAKTIEALVVIIWAHMNPDKNRYIAGLFRSIKIPAGLMKNMCIKGLPLMLNEFLWATGMAMLLQCYSVRGLEVVAAQNIANTLVNIFNIVYIQLGACIAIVVGQKLGAGRLDEAKDQDTKLMVFCVLVCIVVAMFMLPFADMFPEFYNTEPAIKELASFMLVVQAIVMPLYCFNHCAYFTLRSGGRTGITFLFDSVYTWLFMVPLIYSMVHFTSWDIRTVYILAAVSELVKVTIGYIMVKSNIWLRNIVAE